MKKSLLELLILIAIFFGGWFALYQVDWMTLLRVEKAATTTEEKLGKLLKETIEKTETIINEKKIKAPIDSLLKHICRENYIDEDGIKLWIVQRDEINAYAMPDRNLVIYTGLLSACENEAELSGVICHEIAHMEKNHVMKKLMKEIGLSMLVSITTGNSKAGSVREVAKLLSSTAYDRGLEREADALAVEMLVEAGIDAEPLANFMFRLAQTTNYLPKELYWVSTHPDSEERAIAILDMAKNWKYEKTSVLDSVQWSSLQYEVSDLGLE